MVGWKNVENEIEIERILQNTLRCCKDWKRIAQSFEVEGWRGQRLNSCSLVWLLFMIKKSRDCPKEAKSHFVTAVLVFVLWLRHLLYLFGFPLLFSRVSTPNSVALITLVGPILLCPMSVMEPLRTNVTIQYQ